MNLPNQLTVARFFLTLLFVAALSLPWSYSNTAGLAIFVVAGITDYLDGEIARRYKLESNFGKLMDPLVDKILLAAAFICLVEDRALPAWAAVTIISREFLITGLRMLAASRGVVLAADKAGKHKTAWQIITVIFFLVLLSAREILWPPGRPETHAKWHEWYDTLWAWGGAALIALALFLTLYSGLGYLWRNRGLIREI
jgi:CDP-diacylglycerol--glycerol-3-phosphate 3-phosphatidyltransferase